MPKHQGKNILIEVCKYVKISSGKYLNICRDSHFILHIHVILFTPLEHVLKSLNAKSLQKSNLPLLSHPALPHPNSQFFTGKNLKKLNMKRHEREAGQKRLVGKGRKRRKFWGIQFWQSFGQPD